LPRGPRCQAGPSRKRRKGCKPIVWKIAGLPDLTSDETLTVIRLSEVASERVEWLWWRRLPLGKVVILDDDPGLGKSTLTLDLAARVSTGREMPDGGTGIPAAPASSCCRTRTELGDTIGPRLEVAGAHLERVVTFKVFDEDRIERMPELPRDIPAIERVIGDFGARTGDHRTAHGPPRGGQHPSGPGRPRLRRCRTLTYHSDRVLDLDDLRADRGEMDVVDANDYVIGQTAAPIAVVTDNGPCCRGGTFAEAFTGDDPLLRHVRTKGEEPADQRRGRTVLRHPEVRTPLPRDHRRRQCPRRRDQPVPPHLQHPPPPPSTRRPDAATGVPHQPGEPVATVRSSAR
jgi:hypothetical protein